MQIITDLAWLLMRVNAGRAQGARMSCMGQLMHAMHTVQHVYNAELPCTHPSVHLLIPKMHIKT